MMLAWALQFNWQDLKGNYMKIMLILPAAEHLRVTAENKNVPRRSMLRFSVLSLTTVAALTPEEHEVTIYDENVEAVDLADRPDVVGITFMTGLAPRAYELAAHFKAAGAVTVAGGFHSTLCTEEVMRHFDIVVAGEAEGVWPKVLEDIEAGSFEPLYRSSPDQGLDLVPVPRRELRKPKSKYYVTINAVQTGRGCNHNCKFCSVTSFFGQRFRTRPLQNVLAELKTIGRDFMFVDDNIIADPEYARRLFIAMAPMKKRWISQCSIEIADDPELLRLAKKAGCYGLFIGIETLSEENLAVVEKGFNDSKDYLKRIKAIHRAGIGVQAGMIVGLDSDDVTVFERNLRFLQKSGIEALQLAILTPQPGTRLRSEFEQAGRIIDNDWSHYDYRHTVIKPARMSPEELQAGADWLYRQYYRLDRIILRCLRTAIMVSPISAYISLRLNLTYRYDNLREHIVGFNPGERRTTSNGRRAMSGEPEIKAKRLETATV
jgi:radical SAM superfamily enzyme YgiQ (UPF0313 family)